MQFDNSFNRFDNGDSSGGYDSDSGSHSFEWEVNDDSSENYYGHRQSSSGGVTKGSYYVLLPDTRKMTVNYYTEGDSGFVHEINYEGSAQYDSGSYSGSREDQRYSGYRRSDSREYGRF